MRRNAISGSRPGGPPARLPHSSPGPAAVGLLLLVAGCASPGTPIPAGEVQLLAGGATVELPGSCAWRRLPAQGGGMLNPFGCSFDGTRTGSAVATTQPVSRGAEAVYDARVAGVSDTDRVQRILDEIRVAAGQTRGRLEDFRQSVPASAARGGLACRDYGYETTDLVVPGHAGEAFRTDVRGRVCLDPATRRPAILSYSERYRLAEGARPGFGADAAAYLDSFRVPAAAGSPITAGRGR